LDYRRKDPRNSYFSKRNTVLKGSNLFTATLPTMKSSLTVRILTLALLICSCYGSEEVNDFFPLPPQITDDADVECNLECSNNSVCIQGNQSTLGHGTHPLTGGPLDFHKELNRDGWHCDCPHGFTGLRCQQKYVSCTDGDHACYNGGTCIPGLADTYGNEQLYCDCDAAINIQNPQKRHVGKYCEQETNLWDCEEGNVCQNGGSCKIFPDDLQPCDCPEAVFGKYCEYVKDSVPECTKECSNGGYCRLGVDELQLSNNGIEHCECPPAHYGEHCERQAEECGESYCYHGSKCFEILLSVSKNRSAKCRALT
jgi:hypothetical protein